MIPQTDLTWALLQPSNLILLLLALGALLLLFGALRAGRRLVLLALVLVLLPALLPLEALLARRLESRVAPALLPEGVDGILVLGGAVEWQLSRALGQLNTNAAGERLMAAHQLANRYPRAKLVFTGLYREDVPEEFRVSAAGFFGGATYANREVVFLGAARSTYEEALLTLERLRPQTGERWVLVTSAWHMPRALATFVAQGWTLLPYPVDYRSAPGVLPGPSLDVVGRLAAFDAILREWGALLVYERLGRTAELP